MRGRFAVFGSPIGHSLSPWIHAQFAAQFGFAIDYRAIEASLEDYPARLEAFARDGGLGGNVTAPLKQSVVAECAMLGVRARQANAINTLTRSGGSWIGDNTDGDGLIAHLARERIDLRGRRLLLVGAGGGARGALPSLIDAGIDRIVICNRDLSRAQALLEQLGPLEERQAIAPSELEAQPVFDLVLNAASAARHGTAFHLPAELVRQETILYDMNYGTAHQPFAAWAAQTATRVCFDGLGMLVEQAALSFTIWFKALPNTSPVHAALIDIRKTSSPIVGAVLDSLG